MKKILLLCAVCLLTAVNVKAQRLQVVDSDGNAIAYASVFNPNAEYIGITNLEGVVTDVNGATDVVISHVAFKTKSVTLSGKDTVVTLEDAEFDMPEITIQPKPLIYARTYYRMYIYTSDKGIAYYRAGLTDNTYDPVRKTVEGNTKVATKSKSAPLKIFFGMLGGAINRYSQISPKSFEERMEKRWKDVQLKFTRTSPTKQIITDCKGTVGSVTDDMTDHLRCFSYDEDKLFLHAEEVKGKDKAKKEKNKGEIKNKEESHYFLYNIDDEGHYGPEDFVMSQNMSSWDWEKDGKTTQVIACIQVFSTDRAYVTKDELKQRIKQGKMKMDYQNIRRFEEDHRIPALPASVQQKLNEIWKADE